MYISKHYKTSIILEIRWIRLLIIKQNIIQRICTIIVNLVLKELMAERRMDDEVKEYWEGFDAAQAEEEEGRVTNFTGRKEII